MSSLETAILKPETTPFLVFGYGSLIYKPPPHVARRIPGYITSHIRRFWQLSEDHRGTPTHPGRVVTLLTHDDYQHFNTVSADANQTELIESKDLIDSSKGEKCWGVVYEIVPESVEEVKAYLSIREINGYSLTTVNVTTLHDGTLQAGVFIGTPDNPQFSPLPDTHQGLLETARHILGSRGPSGENKEYLYELATALRKVSGDDAGDWYVDELARLVRSIDS